MIQWLLKKRLSFALAAMPWQCSVTPQTSDPVLPEIIISKKTDLLSYSFQQWDFSEIVSAYKDLGIEFTRV